jgi:type VI secretion system protein ImpB
MAGSFQNEIPPARVNIKLDIDKGGAQKKVELPFKMLVLGDFSQKGDTTRLVDKEKINVNKDNFNQVMESMDLGLNMSVENKINPGGGDMKVDLKFKNMKDFNPLEIVKQVPQLSKLLAARNLVKPDGQQGIPQEAGSHHVRQDRHGQPGGRARQDSADERRRRRSR